MQRLAAISSITVPGSEQWSQIRGFTGGRVIERNGKTARDKHQPGARRPRLFGYKGRRTPFPDGADSCRGLGVSAAEVFRRLADGELVIIDGGTGTQLQAEGVPVDDVAWSARANLEQPEVVQRVHEQYIRAGAEVIIANTYAACRAALRPAGLGGLVAEANRAAVGAASRARQTAATRSVAVAGSMSSFSAIDMDAESASRSDRRRPPLSQPARPRRRRELRGPAERPRRPGAGGGQRDARQAGSDPGRDRDHPPSLHRTDQDLRRDRRRAAAELGL
jgi:hypothetical protein